VLDYCNIGNRLFDYRPRRTKHGLERRTNVPTSCWKNSFSNNDDTSFITLLWL